MESSVVFRALAVTLLLAGCGSDSGDEDGPVCGDGAVEGTEECDDGNATSGDSCDTECRFESGWDCSGSPCVPACGDGLVVGEEVCDPLVSPGYCSSDCAQVIGSCGDGAVQLEAESCDPGGGELRGCRDCAPAFGFQCDETSNSCQATGLPPDEQLGNLTEDQTRQYCEWLISVVGGEGKVWICGDYQITNSNVAACTATQFNNWGEISMCTVRQLEDWASARSNRCDLITTNVPIC